MTRDRATVVVPVPGGTVEVCMTGLGTAAVSGRLILADAGIKMEGAVDISAEYKRQSGRWTRCHCWGKRDMIAEPPPAPGSGRPYYEMHRKTTHAQTSTMNKLVAVIEPAILAWLAGDAAATIARIESAVAKAEDAVGKAEFHIEYETKAAEEAKKKVAMARDALAAAEAYRDKLAALVKRAKTDPEFAAALQAMSEGGLLGQYLANYEGIGKLVDVDAIFYSHTKKSSDEDSLEAA